MDKKTATVVFIGGYFTGFLVSAYLGLDFRNYTPERGQRLINILKGKR